MVYISLGVEDDNQDVYSICLSLVVKYGVRSLTINCSKILCDLSSQSQLVITIQYQPNSSVNFITRQCNEQGFLDFHQNLVRFLDIGLVLLDSKFLAPTTKY